MRRTSRMTASGFALSFSMLLFFFFVVYQRRYVFRLRRHHRPPALERTLRPLFFLNIHRTSSPVLPPLLAYAARHALSVWRATPPGPVNHSNPSASRFDVLALQNIPFDKEILNTFFADHPRLILTVVGQPASRAIAHFRLHRAEFNSVSDSDCPAHETSVLDAFDAFVNDGLLLPAQSAQMQERTARRALLPLKMNITQVLAPFSFVFLQHRLADGFECFCKTHHVNLCHTATRATLHVEEQKDCVYHILVQNRVNVLTRGYHRDTELIDILEQRLDACSQNIPEHCQCVES